MKYNNNGNNNNNKNNNNNNNNNNDNNNNNCYVFFHSSTVLFSSHVYSVSIFCVCVSNCKIFATWKMTMEICKDQSAACSFSISIEHLSMLEKETYFTYVSFTRSCASFWWFRQLLWVFIKLAELNYIWSRNIPLSINIL